MNEILPFYIASFFTRKKIENVKEKNVKCQIPGTQFYTVSVRTYLIPFYNGFGSGTVITYGTVPVPLRSVIKLRFRSATAKSYGYGSSSATLVCSRI
jgi:hypothetical protein